MHLIIIFMYLESQGHFSVIDQLLYKASILYAAFIQNPSVT